jgi:hypothetical protein
MVACACAPHGETTASTPAGPVKTPPVSYFNDHCASCHGPGGQNYGPTFGQNLTDAALHQKVKDMAEGQGQAPLTDADLNAEVAYHRALILKQPFVAWSAVETGQISGEVSAGAAVSASAGGKPLKVAQKGTMWAINLDGTKAEDVTVSATGGGGTTTLPLAKASYSQSAPLKKS